MERKLIKVNDAPSIYIDGDDILNGTLEEVSTKILSLKEKLKEAYFQRKSDYEKFSVKSNLTPFEDYKEIKLRCTGYEYLEVELEVFREETDEEYIRRIELQNKRSESAKKAAEARKLTKEKRERTLLENLKKKYEN